MVFTSDLEETCRTLDALSRWGFHFLTAESAWSLQSAWDLCKHVCIMMLHWRFIRKTLFVFHRWQDETPFALSTGTTFVEQRMSAQYSGTSNMTGFSEIRASLVAVREPKVITLFDSKTTVNYFQFYRSLIILIWRKHKWPRLEKFTKSTEETVTADQMNKNMANLSITCRACIHKRALCYYVDM